MSWARAAARLLMPQMFRMGFTANAVYRDLRRMGYGYRRSQMLRDYRSVSGKMRLQDAVEALPGDQRPGKAQMVETELRQPERSYRVFGEVEIYDWERGQWETKRISFYDNYLRTKDEWSAEFIRQKGQYYAAYGQSVQRMRIQAIEHNVGHFY